MSFDKLTPELLAKLKAWFMKNPQERSYKIESLHNGNMSIFIFDADKFDGMFIQECHFDLDWDSLLQDPCRSIGGAA